MPIYNYKCPKCGIDQEVLLPMNQRNDTRCHCGVEMVRVFSIPQPPIMKLSTKERVTGGLNENKRMNPQHAKMAMGGFD